MRTKQEIIIQHFREGVSQRKIAKDLGIHRKTVKRYIRLYQQAKEDQEAAGGVENIFLESLVSTPTYDSKTRHKRKLTQEISERIEGYLKQNQTKRKEGLHKQQMKKIDIWEALRLEGYDIGYTTVCNYIRLQQSRRAEAYIKQSYEPGVECEFDWGEVRLILEGKVYRLMLAVFTAAMSNYRWARLFWRQDTSSFQQAHVDFFSHTRGVFQCMVYDNMRVAIRAFTGRNERELTDSFLQLSSYYQFGWRFCNVGQAHEKGHVERSVEYVRRKAFSNQDSFENLEGANAYLEGVCNRLNRLPLQGKVESATELFEQEKPQLYPAAADFDCGQLEEFKVDKYSTISLGTNHYSVPDHLVGKRVSVRVYPTQLRVYWQGQQQCSHERRRGQNGWYIELDHYLYTLCRKPGALAGSLALKTADKRLRNLFEQHFKDRPKVFIELLQYQRHKALSLESIEQAIQTCVQLCPTHAPCLDKIKLLCSNNAGAVHPKSDVALEGLIEQASKKQLQVVANLFSDQKKVTS
jgi:transposase